MKKLQDTIEQIGEAFQSFRIGNDERLNALEKAQARSKYPIGGGSASLGEGPTAAQAEHKSKFLAWARKGADADGLRKIEASLSTLSDPDGGYLVPVEIEKNIERLALDSVAMRRLARVLTSRGEYSRPLSKGGATGGWVSEKETRTETDTPKLVLFSPPMCELYAEPMVTQKLLDMSNFDIASWLVEEICDVFCEKEGAAFVSGNGVGRPAGILQTDKMIANASWTYGKTGFVTSGHATLLSSVDSLINLQHALKPVYRQNGTFLMNDSTLAKIRKIKDGDGDYIWRPGLTENAPDMLLGRPVAIDENMADVGADAYPICFADFSRAYTIIDDLSGTRLLRDPFTEKGSVAFYTIKRLAAGISNWEALKFLKISA